MAGCDISVSFSALIVNINPPWPYGKHFSDIDLEFIYEVKPNTGQLLLHYMNEEQKVKDNATWSHFPAYPTSFIVADNTTIEFRGATEHVKEHFTLHSGSNCRWVGYRPWSTSRSFHESGTEQSMCIHYHYRLQDQLRCAAGHCLDDPDLAAPAARPEV